MLKPPVASYGTVKATQPQNAVACLGSGHSNLIVGYFVCHKSLNVPLCFCFVCLKQHKDAILH